MNDEDPIEKLDSNRAIGYPKISLLISDDFALHARVYSFLLESCLENIRWP